MENQNNTQTFRRRIFITTWVRLALLLVFLLPLAIMFLVPGGGLLGGFLLIWLMLLFSVWAIWMAVARSGERAGPVAMPEIHPLDPAEQPDPIRDVMDVRTAFEESGVRVFRGKLRDSAEAAYEKLKQAFGAETVPLIQEDDQHGAVIFLMPRSVEKTILEKRTHTWVNWLLFVLTILTTTWAGAAQQGVDLFREPGRFYVGLPYSIGLLAILGVHELGHYFAGRHHGMNVTPPYFIPVPFALGTFGAFIKMRSPAENRRALFDVAVAGPLAGLLIAIPALLLGLHSSEVVGSSLVLSHDSISGPSAGSSILFALLARLSLGHALLQGDVLRLSPLAFAGWLGLIITALNLLPIGQLDGGHTTRAMFGHRVGRVVSTVAMAALFLLALFKIPGLLMWAIIVFFIAGRSAPPLNDVTPITPGRRWVGLLAFVILALILIRLPQGWWNALGIYRPQM